MISNSNGIQAIPWLNTTQTCTTTDTQAANDNGEQIFLVSAASVQCTVVLGIRMGAEADEKGMREKGPGVAVEDMEENNRISFSQRA